ncbi:MAG: response regulator [Eubacteriales bacterium]
MYKVMIIDDESIIVEGMQRAVNWKQFGCEVCGTAYDGASGLKLIQELKPDILFTDICMPNMTGLAMLAALKSEMPRMQATILTGYHDFAYAQEAVRLGVVRLLTKPSRMDEIQEAIEAMTTILKGLPPEEKPVLEEQAAASFVVRGALAFMDENYNQKLTLQMVAEHCYVSQWHLSKLLNRHTDKSFYDILNAVRIKKAKELLLDPKLRVADIGELVGYNDTAHFSRTFKKVEGVSANEYRNKRNT